MPSLEQNELTEENFEKYFFVALSKPNQTRGEHQEGTTGTFKNKTFVDLSWRGLLRRLLLEKSVEVTCKCDEEKPKNKAQAIIKHVERRHQDENGKITLDVEDFKVVFPIS